MLICYKYILLNVLFLTFGVHTINIKGWHHQSLLKLICENKKPDGRAKRSY